MNFSLLKMANALVSFRSLRCSIRLTNVIEGSAGKALRGRLFAVIGLGCDQFDFTVNFGPDEFRYSRDDEPDSTPVEQQHSSTAVPEV
jgi:hypothetical protein